MKSLLLAVGNWFDARLSLRDTAAADAAASDPPRARPGRWAGGTSSAARRSRCS